MKKFFNLLIICLIIASTIFSCTPSIKGEGNISNKDTVLTPYTKLILKGNYNVFFLNDSIHSLTIESNENLLTNINIQKDDDVLTLSEIKNVSESDIYKVTLSAKYIQEIILNDNVQFEVLGQMNQEKLTIKMSDNSKFIGNIAVSDFNISQQDNANSNFLGSASKAKLNLEDNATFISPLLNISEGNFQLYDNTEAKVTTIKSLEGTGKDNSKLFYQGEPNKDYTTKEQAICEKGK